MPRLDSAALRTCRFSLVVAMVGLSGIVAPAVGQSPPPPAPAPQPLVLQNLTDTSVTVTFAQLDLGQTLTKAFAPAPNPSYGVMSLNGEWPHAVISNGDAHFNRKIRAVLRAPFGQLVASGCGYSKNAKATVLPANTPALSAVGQYKPGITDAPGLWHLTVNYCDSVGSPPVGPSRVLGEIKIIVSYHGLLSLDQDS